MIIYGARAFIIIICCVVTMVIILHIGMSCSCMEGYINNIDSSQCTPCNSSEVSDNNNMHRTHVHLHVHVHGPLYNQDTARVPI